MMKFERQSLKIDVYGQQFDVKRVSVGKLQEYSAKVKNMSEEESASALLDLISECGIPAEVTSDMQPDHLNELVEYLIPSKKK